MQWSEGTGKENVTETTKHNTEHVLPIVDSSKVLVADAFPKALMAVTLTL